MELPAKLLRRLKQYLQKCLRSAYTFKYVAAIIPAIDNMIKRAPILNP